MRAEVIRAADGTRLVSRVYEPEVRQDYYAPFAQWLATQGWRVQHKVSGMLSVAAGSGYWRENAPQLKRIVMTLRGTHSLINLYENAPREVERIAPADVGVRRLGHFGPFRSEHEARLWPRMAQWFNGLSAPRAA